MCVLINICHKYHKFLSKFTYFIFIIINIHLSIQIQYLSQNTSILLKLTPILWCFPLFARLFVIFFSYCQHLILHQAGQIQLEYLFVCGDGALWLTESQMMLMTFYYYYYYYYYYFLLQIQRDKSKYQTHVYFFLILKL